MAGKFNAKYKKRNLLFLLLSLFREKAKFVVLTTLVVVATVPLVNSNLGVVNRLFSMPPVAAALKMAGLGSMVSSLDLNSRREFIRSAVDKAAVESAKPSFWSRVMPASLPVIVCPNCSKRSSIGMAKDETGFLPWNTPPFAATAPADRIAGVAAKANEAITGKMPGPAVKITAEPVERGELIAESPGASLLQSANAPFLDRKGFSGKGGTMDPREALLSGVMKQQNDKVPVPGLPKKVAGAKLGKASGFSWRNVGYQTRSASVDKKQGSKRPMFQLAETFSATGSAYRSPDSAYEYQAAYTGSTYDGNDVSLDIIKTGEGEPTLPKFGFAADLSEISRLQGLAEQCAKAQSEEGAKMSEDADEMDKLSQTMKDPPKCYEDIDGWNNKVDRLNALCGNFNTNQSKLASACQTSNSPMDCSTFQKDTKNGGMKINKCQNPFTAALMLLLILLLVVILVALAIAVIIGPMVAAMFAVTAAVGMAVGAMVIKNKIEDLVKQMEKETKELTDSTDKMSKDIDQTKKDVDDAAAASKDTLDSMK